MVERTTSELTEPTDMADEKQGGTGSLEGWAGRVSVSEWTGGEGGAEWAYEKYGERWREEKILTVVKGRSRKRKNMWIVEFPESNEPDEEMRGGRVRKLMTAPDKGEEMVGDTEGVKEPEKIVEAKGSREKPKKARGSRRVAQSSRARDMVDRSNARRSLTPPTGNGNSTKGKKTTKHRVTPKPGQHPTTKNKKRHDDKTPSAKKNGRLATQNTTISTSPTTKTHQGADKKEHTGAVAMDLDVGGKAQAGARKRSRSSPAIRSRRRSTTLDQQRPQPLAPFNCDATPTTPTADTPPVPTKRTKTTAPPQQPTDTTEHTDKPHQNTADRMTTSTKNTPLARHKPSTEKQKVGGNRDEVRKGGRGGRGGRGGGERGGGGGRGNGNGRGGRGRGGQEKRTDLGDRDKTGGGTRGNRGTGDEGDRDRGRSKTRMNNGTNADKTTHNDETDNKGQGIGELRQDQQRQSAHNQEEESTVAMDEGRRDQRYGNTASSYPSNKRILRSRL